jgi:hypothetical protein
MPQGEHLMRKLIRTDGTEEELHGPVSMADVEQMIGAATVDCVSLRHLGKPLHVMIVDDHGYETEHVDHGNGHSELRPVRALKPFNDKATELYWANCRPGTQHRIVGDVVIVPDDDFA